MIFSQFQSRGSTGIVQDFDWFWLIFYEFSLNFGSRFGSISFKNSWFYYQISFKIVSGNERNISFNFHDFIINFSLIWPRYSNFIFVSLLIGFWSIIGHDFILIWFYLNFVKKMVKNRSIWFKFILIGFHLNFNQNGVNIGNWSWIVDLSQF